MRRKFFATFCAAAMLVSAVSVAAPQTVKAAPAPLASYDFEDGFGDMTAAANGETVAPSLGTDEIKGGTLKLEFGANGAESYTTFANPYVGKELSAATITMWVNVPETAANFEWDNLLGFTDGTKRLTIQTKPYVCWNAGADENWIDKKGSLVFQNQRGRWVNYALVITPEGQTIFVNGEEVTEPEVSDGDGYNAADILPFLSAETTQAYLGFGSFWGSQEAFLDDITFYDAALTADEIKEACNIEAVLAAMPEFVEPDPTPTPEPIVYEKVDLSTVTAAVPEGYSSFYAFDGDLTDAVTGQTGNTVGYKVSLEADEEAASFETGVKGQAVAFYGFGDGVKLPTAPKGSQYTISIDWYLKKTSQYTPGIFMGNFYEDGALKGTDEDAEWISIAPLGWQEDLVNGPMIWSRNVAGGAPWNDVYRLGNDLAKVETWFNVTVVADGATATIYVDGSVVAEGPIADIIGENTQLYLGVNDWDTVFNGYMDNLYIYDRCLTAEEVASLAKESLTVVQADPTPTPEPTAAPDPTATTAPTSAPTTTAAASAPTDDSNSSSSNTGLIVGIVIVVVVVAGVVVAVMMKKKK
ncbi:MAG: LamG domain-containing protein [Lachnospiraceae bacterium]|nr:LamG domain-containing protein [Lachnospiraceae bacterium]